MGKFEQSFRMTTADAAEYAIERGLFPAGADLSVAEIGDGNINYVYRVAHSAGRSVILKHSHDFMRNSDTRALSAERALIESEILRLHHRLAPGFVPEVLEFDPVMHITVMEDLREIEMMRKPLARWQTFPRFAEQIADFLFNTLVRTSDIALDPAEKRHLAARFVNPDLCEITDRLVFTEPYRNRQGLNSYSPYLDELVQQRLYGDEDLHARVAALKEGFRNHAQSLIHGDLHTGSIFVSGAQTKVLDPEFGCYGPMGYDIGNVLGNLVFPLVSADVSEGVPDRFRHWVVTTIAEIVDRFAARFRTEYDGLCADPLYTGAIYRERLLAEILSDTAGYAGTEIIRRTVGVAKVVEISRVTDPAARARLERALLDLGVTLISDAPRFSCGDAYRQMLTERTTA